MVFFVKVGELVSGKHWHFFNFPYFMLDKTFEQSLALRMIT